MDAANTNSNGNANLNWRAALSHESRHKIVNKIMDTLQKHMPPTGPDGMNELGKIALRFEEKIYSAATDQQDYLRKISLKMLSLRNHVTNQDSSSGSNQKPQDPAVQMIPSHIRNSLPLPEQSQSQQTFLQNALQTSMSGGGMHNITGLPSTISSINSLSQNPNGQVFNTQSAINNPTGQAFPQSAVLNDQRRLQSRSQQNSQQLAQQHQQLQAQHPLYYQQQLPHQVLANEKFQQQSPFLQQHQQQQSTLPETSQSFIEQHPQSVEGSVRMMMEGLQSGSIAWQ